MATLHRDGDRLFIGNIDMPGVSVQITGWEKVDAVGRSLSWMARGLYPPERTHVASGLYMQKDGDMIVVELKGQVFLRVPTTKDALSNPSAAEMLGNAILGVARLIQEDADVDQVVFDAALLQRAGMLPGLSLTGDQRKQDLIRVEAAHNPTLRAAIRGAVRDQVVRVGHPTVISPPRKLED